jgi:hypothetical protein
MRGGTELLKAVDDPADRLLRARDQMPTSACRAGSREWPGRYGTITAIGQPYFGCATARDRAMETARGSSMWKLQGACRCRGHSGSAPQRETMFTSLFGVDATWP